MLTLPGASVFDVLTALLASPDRPLPILTRDTAPCTLPKPMPAARVSEVISLRVIDSMATVLPPVTVDLPARGLPKLLELTIALVAFFMLVISIAPPTPTRPPLKEPALVSILLSLKARI